MQLQVAQDCVAAAEQKLVTLRCELLGVRAAADRRGRELTKANNALKSDLRDQQSLNKTISTSSQDVRLQLEAAKVCSSQAAAAENGSQYLPCWEYVWWWPSVI